MVLPTQMEKERRTTLHEEAGQVITDSNAADGISLSTY